MQLTSCDHSIGAHTEIEIIDSNTENGHCQSERQIYVCDTCGETLDGDPQHDAEELRNEAYSDAEREIFN